MSLEKALRDIRVRALCVAKAYGAKEGVDWLARRLKEGPIGLPARAASWYNKYKSWLAEEVN